MSEVENEVGIFAPIEDVLVSTGRGIARAQAELDMVSIETQRKIDENDDEVEGLQEAGISATWYTIPETEIKLKIAVSVEQETKTTSKGKVRNSRLLLRTMDATYQNLFGYSHEITSELRAKIVPVPRPPKATKEVLDVTGETMPEGIRLLREAGFSPNKTIPSKIKIKDDNKTVILDTTPKPGTPVSFDHKKIEVIFTNA
jgi:hypothetical protein